MSVKHAIRAICFSVISLIMIVYLGNKFSYTDYTIWSTDARIKSYKSLPENSVDVLFLGSSNVMCSINPMQIWKETGLQCYNYCGRAQTLPFTYAYLLDALKTQSPECIFIDVWSVFSDHNVHQLSDSEFHFRVNMESLSWNRQKFQLIRNYVAPSDQLGCYLPILETHNDYKTWKMEWDDTYQIYMGYCYVNGHTEFSPPLYTNIISNIPESDKAAVDDIIKLCEDKGIQLYFIKTPVVLSDKQHAFINGLDEYLHEKDVPFFDMSLNSSMDFSFENGLSDNTHVNTTGAHQVTRFITDLLLEILDDQERATHQYAYVWEEEYCRMLNVLNPPQG